MLLNTHTWGAPAAECVVCVHGLTQHGGVFEGLGLRLADAGHHVVSVDLRGHGASGREPPWNTEAHVDDLLETLDSIGVERATLIGHSFGGRMAAAFAAAHTDRVPALALLEPGFGVPPERALRGAEIDRLDWSFATIDGAVNALLSSATVVSAPREVVAEYVRGDVKKGLDGRYRFSFCSPAVVVAWSEMVRPAPPIAQVPTLVLVAATPLIPNGTQAERYRDALGDLLTAETVPNGHNMLWESPEETISAIGGFLGRTCGPVARAHG